ncbi:DUF3899 domain-containing protein [Aerococcus suis]|uniref:DUF3899 domain-containing protein n=1 Tax=Aerococcus suis TaxID=371602 RepID=A0A1W1YET4_9LACT|nr:DUF3899 domain-containing protein [Aerococcus suis]MDY4646880.1 DUF3899 domain-containing protein [Aerococcus suis]SMC34288.1 protein of unknown function [Aerococcus suis]
MTKPFYKILLAIGILIPIIWAFIQDNLAITHALSNAYFYLCVPLLIIGLFTAVLKAGTFDLFASSFKKYGPFKKNDYTIDKSATPNELSRKVTWSPRPFLMIGSLFLLLSLIFLLFYYI